MQNLTQKLEAFSSLLKEINSSDSKVPIDLKAISKLNRLKRKLENIKFIHSWQEKRNAEVNSC